MNSPLQKSQVDVLERELTPNRLRELSYKNDEPMRKLREFPYGDDWAPRRKNDNLTNGECTCGLPNKKYCMLTSVSRKGHENRKKIVWAPMSICKVFSSSTPTVPYSTADILYGNEVNGSRGQQAEDVRQNSFGELERSRDLARSRSKELELNPNNKRPSSRSGKQKSLSIDSVTPFDKDREDPLRSLSSALPPAKPSHHFRPNGIRSSIVKSDQLYSSKTNGAVSGRDQDDLVAMGTLWSPNNNQGQPPPPVASSQQQQQTSNRNNSVSNSNTNSFPSKVVSSSSSVNQSNSLSNNTLNTQRKYPGNNIRPIVVQNNVSGRKNSNSLKEQEEPKYTDPMIGAPASFQQRIIELGALEGDTVRWERTKRLKKKKQDRDS